MEKEIQNIQTAYYSRQPLRKNCGKRNELLDLMKKYETAYYNRQFLKT